MFADWTDEDTLPLWQLDEANLDEETSQLSTEMRTLVEKANKLGFKNLDSFADYYGFTSFVEIKRHLLNL